MAANKQAEVVDAEYEQWENTTAGRVSLKFYNQQGILQDKLIDSHRKFQITPKERKLNQEMAAGADLDHFANGIFAPIRLIETSDDVEQIRSNPNLVSEAEMKELFGAKKSLKAFQERVDAITNPYALTRMLELAQTDDSATAKQVAAVEERLKVVSPSTYQEITQMGGPTAPPPPNRFPGAVTTSELGR